MTSTKDTSDARRAADQRLREEFRQRWEEMMHEEHAARGVTWRRRLSPQEREERDRMQQRKAKLEKIAKLATEAGLSSEDVVEALSGEDVAVGEQSGAGGIAPRPIGAPDPERRLR